MTERATPPHGSPGRRAIAAVWALVFISSAASAAILLQRPPAAPRGEVLEREFSAHRAFEHIKAIATAPRPSGSEPNANARAYLERTIDALGIIRSSQSAKLSRDDGTELEIANVAARVKGSGKPALKAILLVAHFDSVRIAPGACDNGSGVATLLETLRALKSGPPLERDIIALFTDAEEIGAHGARIFLGQDLGGIGPGHPWVSDVGLVFNFDASGNRGPSVILETSDRNFGLVSEFVKADAAPIGNSLTPVMYRLAGGYTDFNSFVAAGLPGLNFVFFEGKESYHSELDRPELIDLGSLQHHGGHALALARHFGSKATDRPRLTNAVYFNPFGSWMVAYPVAWAIPFALAATALTAFLIFASGRSGRLSWRGFAAAGVVFPVVFMLSAAMSCGAAWRAMRFQSPTQSSVLGVWVGIATTAAAILVFVALYAMAAVRISPPVLDLGVQCWWAIGALATACLLPEASHLAVWPLLARSATSLVAWKAGRSVLTALLVDLGTLPAFGMIGAGAYSLFTNLTPALLPFSAASVVLVMSVCLPTFLRPCVRAEG